MESTGTFGRRSTKRHAVETAQYEERRAQGTCFPVSSQSTGGLAELEGDSGPALPTREMVCLASARLAMTPPLENVTAQTRLHLLGTTDTRAAEKAARKKQRARKHDSGLLRDLTAETRTLVVGLIRPREPREEEAGERPRQRRSKFTEQGLSPGNRRIDDFRREETDAEPIETGPRSRLFNLKVPSLHVPIPIKLRSPRRTVSVSRGTRTVSVQGTRFDLIEPAKKQTQQPPVVARPPRTTSKNFSLPLPRADGPYKSLDTPTAAVEPVDTRDFMGLPLAVRYKIYSLLIICDHEVFICVCCPCSVSAHKQPALALVNRTLRSEILPIYYGENRFMIRGEYDWDTKAPAWLRCLQPSTRDLIKRVEISTRDLSSAVCMMATLGFALSHALPFEGKLGLLREVQDCPLWMTFTAIGRKVHAYENLPEIKRLVPLSIWDITHVRDSVHVPEAEPDSRSIVTVETVSTGVLDLDQYDGVIGQGLQARQVRGRCVTVGGDESGHEDNDEGGHENNEESGHENNDESGHENNDESDDEEYIERGLESIAFAYHRLMDEEALLADHEA
ncbi:hypothetical protein LTR53_007734 [Teratosphaeriaceae sp. CCFEE 6253]|nr:hypothetical protein LTR53_007734 [Teratosphaeriaceae sp. CCFEE 6253]